MADYYDRITLDGLESTNLLAIEKIRPFNRLTGEAENIKKNSVNAIPLRNTHTRERKAERRYYVLHTG